MMGALTPVLVAGVGAFAAAFVGLSALATARRADDGSAPRDERPLFVPETRLLGVTRAVASLALPLDRAERAAVAEQLVQAGFDDRTALSLWFAIRAVSALVPVAPVWLLLRRLGPAPTFLGVLVAVAVGYVLPVLVLRALRALRQGQVRRAAPTMLDMLVSTLGSGLALEPSLAHVAREIAFVSPAMGLELDRVRAEIATGLPRIDAFREFAWRTGVEETEALVSLLGQSDRFGASIAASLRSHAEAARKRRLLEAEQRATRMTGWLTIVMVIVMLPSVVVVLVGPMIVEVATTIFGTGGAA